MRFLFTLGYHTLTVIASSVEEAQRTADLSYPGSNPVFIGIVTR